MRPCARSCKQQSGKNAEEANEYVEKLKSEKRYKRDVY